MNADTKHKFNVAVASDAEEHLPHLSAPQEVTMAIRQFAAEAV